MSVLSDKSLRIIYPNTEHVGPSSIDLHIGDTLLAWPPFVLRDPRIDQADRWKPAHREYSNGLVWALQPGIRYLASTIERVTIRPDCAGMISTRSSWARDGLAAICGSAGWLDAGFEGTVTLELSVVGSELVIWPGAAICQLVVLRMTTPAERPYGGKYTDQTGPTPSRMHTEVHP